MRSPIIYEDGVGYDVYSRLLKENIVMVTGTIEDNMATDIVAQLILLDHSNDKDINMYINSPGGSVTAGLSIIDTMNSLKCDVNTYCMGMCASMGSAILSQGTKGKRYALPNSHIMIHQVSAGAKGTVADMEKTYQFANSLNDRLAKMLAKSTGKTQKRIKADMDRDNYMTALEAKEYGIVDQVV